MLENYTKIRLFNTECKYSFRSKHVQSAIILIYFELFLSGQVQMLSIYGACLHIYILKAIAN